jgi:hypothetical protein
VGVPSIAPSARKHGITDADMTHAFNNPIRVDEIDEGFTMFIGWRLGRQPARGRCNRQQRRPDPRARHGRPSQLPEVMRMPRTAQEILDQAEALADRFERFEPEPGSGVDAAALRDLRVAFQNRADAEKQLAEAVEAARTAGHSWASIGAMVGTSGEAARQRYGQSVRKP